MTQYQLFYRRALELICSGESFSPTLEQVMRSDYPATDYSSRAISNAERAITDAIQTHHTAAIRAHPHWHYALQSGASEQECFRIWQEEGGSNYTKELLNGLHVKGCGNVAKKRLLPLS